MSDKKLFKYKFPILIIFIFVIFVYLFGGNLPRFLFEGYLWFIYLISKNFRHSSISYKFFSKFIYLQMIIIIQIYLFYIVNLFPGSLVQNTKYSIMLKNSNGYELAKWTNQKLDKNDVLISTHTSISLFEMKTFKHF